MSGADILSRARAHFRNARTVETLRKIAVPEWGCDLHYWPEMSLEESREVGRHIRLAAGRMEITAGDLAEAAVTQIVHRARDQNGLRLFTDEDVTAIRDTDPRVLQRIASEMGWTSGATLEDAEGN
jgi:hypothetical protein